MFDLNIGSKSKHALFITYEDILNALNPFTDFILFIRQKTLTVITLSDFDEPPC